MTAKLATKGPDDTVSSLNSVSISYSIRKKPGIYVGKGYLKKDDVQVRNKYNADAVKIETSTLLEEN